MENLFNLPNTKDIQIRRNQFSNDFASSSCFTWQF
uniref:Uncharacterized protein n=1 Tax=Arundo donax TaxID=35708 RepID=A0A0A9GKF1_ARUDO